MKKTLAILLFLSLLSSAAYASTTYPATTAEGHAIVETGTASYSDIVVTKTGDGDDNNKSEYYDWYGRNAAILASGDSANITITSADISSNATYASAVFAYGGTINISDASITTAKKNSGGIMVTGGGTITASDLTVTTAEGSSAAIRSDKGGGTITVDGGTYTANGSGSPAIYSTAAITVSNATLNSGVAQGVVIEGGNSVTLKSSDVNAKHTTKNGQDSTYQAVLIYQSGSGDASEGSSSFTMTNGSITNTNGDIFCVTNTTCTINLTGVSITNNDTSGNFLRAEGQNWGSNGGTVTLNASGQTISGDIIVASDSSLTMNLTGNSSYKGAINPDTASIGSVSTAATGGTVNINVASGSKLTLTGDSVISSISAVNSSDIDYGNYTLTVGSTAYTASNPYAGNDSVSDEITNSDDNGDGTNTTNNGSGGSPSNPGSNNNESDSDNNGSNSNNNSSDNSNSTTTTGSSGSGCNFGFAGVILSACVVLMMKKK